MTYIINKPKLTTFVYNFQNVLYIKSDIDFKDPMYQVLIVLI